MKEEAMTDGNLSMEQWQAIMDNDTSYDKKFYYGVQTRGIFCRPSCKSRPPKKENVKIFENPQQALDEDYRPCKRCKPTDKQLPAEEWVDQVATYIDTNFAEHLTLQILADLFHGSPFHLQRTFKQIKSISPTEYIQEIRISKAMEYLTASGFSVMDIALAVGISNMAYFGTLFKQKTGYTPTAYRQLNN
ncbi:bifunctional transcriptional activator/DNA repair enzyme AdaA [Shimazuella kribbensis]|uniref:bifunctional transcriptional activator/DNA repair enzyme AdaA n=1 Tax=Shimazuella kribbensis TaxID=139808 RepID=UPI0003F803B4|nr:bifunctional transcriptional activator/DNA repair enzyme AdaA [Shimazuella kribbensis]